MILQSVKNIICDNTKLLLDKDAILALWWTGNNWGDKLNPILIQKLSGKKPVLLTKYIVTNKNKTTYSVIGSILNTEVTYFRDINLVVWGTGFISYQDRLLVRPQRICAVRGPLTREILVKQGFECPEIYGDPALLYPRFFMPKVNKKYKLGIIPHFLDKKNKILDNFQNNSDVLLIDIQGGINEVVEKIMSCQKIASSSLHGIIAADAYGIPSTWIELSDKVTGNGFKFFDYFQSVGRNDEESMLIDQKISVDDILARFYSYKLEIDMNELWEVCPFRRPKVFNGES